MVTNFMYPIYGLLSGDIGAPLRNLETGLIYQGLSEMVEGGVSL